MFVTAQDFELMPYVLPNLATVDSVEPNVMTDNSETFTRFVVATEDEFLPKILGSFFYDTMRAQLAILPAWDETVPTVVNNWYSYGVDVWKALTVQTGTAPEEGVNWELLEEGNRWLELKNGVTYTANKRKRKWEGMKNLVRPLVYSQWVRSRATYLAENGMDLANSENSTSQNPGEEIANSWNRYAELVGYYCHSTFYSNTLFTYLDYFSEEFDDLFTDDDYGTMKKYLHEEFQSAGHQNVFDL